MEKTILAIFFNLYCFISFSNSASPYIDGTITTTINTTKELTILNEKLIIQPNRNFTQSKFHIEYSIKAEKDLKNIPIVFVALNYLNEFDVKLDGKRIQFIHFDSDSINDIEYFSKKFSGLSSFDSKCRCSMINFNEAEGRFYFVKDLKYYTIDLSKGIHKITVEYLAKKTIDLREKIKLHFFNYSLYPARFWKSFGCLEVVLDLSKCNKELKCNLGKIKLNKESKAVYQFKKIPNDNIILSYQIAPTKTASFFISIGYFPIGLFFSIILMLFHLYIIRWFAKRNKSTLTFLTTFLGVFFVPFLFIWCFIYAEDLIDFIIGSEASRRGSAHYLIFILPLIYFVYFILLTLYYIAQKNKIE